MSELVKPINLTFIRIESITLQFTFDELGRPPDGAISHRLALF
jgi:hypothetical protein